MHFAGGFLGGIIMAPWPLGVAASSNLHPCNVVGEVRVNTFTVEQLEV